MKTAANRMTELTSQLLAYARGGNYQVKPISLSDFVREKLPLLQRAFKYSIHVDTDLRSDVWKTKGDWDQMQTVLSALFETEEKATKKQKIRRNRATGTLPMIENEEYGTKMIRQRVGLSEMHERHELC
jgi:C4-dicarboxylate-specific signal transduction histidine kinase